MSKSTHLVFMLFVTAIFLNCNVNRPGNQNPTLTIKGKVASVALTKTGMPQVLQRASVAAVKNVLVYRDFGDADLSPVDAAGSFSVEVARKACGLVFLDALNKVVGYLSLAAGVEAIPLMMVDSSVTQIDLKEITILDSIGTPQHNPLDNGGETEMTTVELAVYKLQSSLFSAIIRNLDMNNDGVIDVLSSHPYWLMFGADFFGGVAANADPGNSGSMPVLGGFHFNFSDYGIATSSAGGNLLTPDSKNFAIHETRTFTFMKNDKPGTTATMYHWVLQNTDWDSFISGTYAITYETDKQVSFAITIPLKAENYIVAAHLWYEMSGKKITKVHWTWKMLNGSAIDATRLMQRDVILQFNYGLTSQINYHITPAESECTVDVDTTSLSSLLLSCNDLFGNWQPTNYLIR